MPPELVSCISSLPPEFRVIEELAAVLVFTKKTTLPFSTVIEAVHALLLLKSTNPLGPGRALITAFPALLPPEIKNTGPDWTLKMGAKEDAFVIPELPSVKVVPKVKVYCGPDRNCMPPTSVAPPVTEMLVTKSRLNLAVLLAVGIVADVQLAALFQTPLPTLDQVCP